MARLRTGVLSLQSTKSGLRRSGTMGLFHLILNTAKMLDNIKFLAWQDYAGLNLNEKVKPKKKRKMKRQILFRGWSSLQARWVEGNFTYDSIGQPRIIKVESSGQGLTFIPVHPDSVGQFTGLLDMEGNKVFEGDTITSLERKSAESVIFINGAFRLTGYSDNNKAPILDSFEVGAIKITGNTFNPDHVQ
jgi:hypothetical protein